MKKPDAGAALIAPDLEGWRVGGKKYATLDQVAASLPEVGRLHLALPCTEVLIERLKLPSTDREELSGMLQLHFEKTLPYPIDEVTTEFEVLGTGENESTLLTVAAHHGQIDDHCHALREAERLPDKITLYARHVAAACPPGQVVLAIYAEQGQTVVVIVEHGKLGWAETLPGTDPETFASELPRLLLPAEMEGVPTDFASVRLASDLEPLAAPLTQYFEKPVEFFSLDEALPEPPGNLLPPAWEVEEKRLERARRLKQQLLAAAVVWLLAIAGAFIYLAWLKQKERKLAVELAAAKPELDFILTREARWQALAPSIEPGRFTVELLYHLHKNLPNAEVKITELDQQITGWKVVGEAPSAALAIDYVDKLKKDPEISAWQINAGQPQILPNEHAQFTIFGKQ
jgi:hypothetical protein